MIKKVAVFIKKLFGRIIILLGCITFVAFILAFTRLPFDWQRWLGTQTAAFDFEPQYIIMLGGSGMPSESNLMRLYYTSGLAHQYPEAKIIIAHPLDTAVVNIMRAYLVENNVDAKNIFTETLGVNTREQALQILRFFPDLKNKSAVLVTSPENMYRSLLVFRKAGFNDVGGQSAFENAMFVDLVYDTRKIGGKAYIPDVSGSLDLRYNFWNYLKLEISCYREFFALVYYKLNGWI